MSQRYHTAGVPDQRDSLLDIKSGIVNASRTSVAQIKRETVAGTGYLAGEHQVESQVSPAQIGARKCSSQLNAINGHSQLFEHGSHCLESFNASGAKPCQSCAKWRVAVVDEVSQEVQFAASPGAR